MAKPCTRSARAAGRSPIAVVISVVTFAVPALLGLPGRAQAFAMAPGLFERAANSPLIFVQNPVSPFTLQEMPEPPVSPRNAGTLPGTTSASGGSAARNPITGLPCSGGGSISVSGPAGLGGTTTPIGTPSVTSIYGQTSSFGAC